MRFFIVFVTSCFFLLFFVAFCCVFPIFCCLCSGLFWFVPFLVFFFALCCRCVFTLFFCCCWSLFCVCFLFVATGNQHTALTVSLTHSMAQIALQVPSTLTLLFSFMTYDMAEKSTTKANKNQQKKNPRVVNWQPIHLPPHGVSCG